MVIETERLLIRRFLKEDAKDLFEYLSLPEIYKFEPGSPISMEEAVEICNEREKGNRFLAVQLKDESKTIGHIYFSLLNPIDFQTWEIGYIFNPLYWNHGYCTEACMAVIKKAFSEMNVHRINANCNPKNNASWKVLEKIGLKREGYKKEKAFFRKNEDGTPLWHDCFEYGLIEKDYSMSNHPTIAST